VYNNSRQCIVTPLFTATQATHIINGKMSYKKSLKIPIGESEAVNQRSDNTMDKGQKGQKDK
jgi:hypothetical protein